MFTPTHKQSLRDRGIEVLLAGTKLKATAEVTPTYLFEWNTQLANPCRHLCTWGPSAFGYAPLWHKTPYCNEAVDAPQSSNRWRWGASPGTDDSQRKSSLHVLTSFICIDSLGSPRCCCQFYCGPGELLSTWCKQYMCCSWPEPYVSPETSWCPLWCW